MTEQNDTQSQSGQASAEVEVTPEMIEAGVKAYLAWEESDEPSHRKLVREVYQRMKMADTEDRPLSDT